MGITAAMIEAARRAEFDYYQRGRLLGQDRLIPTPDPVIRAMLEAAFSKIPDETAATAKPPAIVTAAKPRRRRMTRPGALGGKLTPIQFRLLRRIPNEGLSLSALRQGHGYGTAAQIRTLRILCQQDLTVETKGDGDDVRFLITDAGRRLLEHGAR